NAPPPTTLYTLSLHDALPICRLAGTTPTSEGCPMSHMPASDAQLVERMAAGDRRAHEQLGDRHRLSLYARVYALLADAAATEERSEEHTSELQSRGHLVCRLL